MKSYIIYNTFSDDMSAILQGTVYMYWYTAICPINTEQKFQSWESCQNIKKNMPYGCLTLMVTNTLNAVLGRTLILCMMNIY